MYGAGDGSTTFNLPDYRGYFLRGWSHGTSVDPDRASRTNRGDGTTGDNVGTKQEDELKSHTHFSNVSGTSSANGTTWDVYTAGGVDAGDNFQGRMSYAGGNESRPKNVNVLYCIKY